MKVAVIGAGASGLVAAIELEKGGAEVTVFESTNGVGGRMKTDVIDGIPYDNGFQVLQTAYPMAQEYLDYEKLSLKRFKPGAVVFMGGKKYKIGDVQRDPSFLFTSLSAPVGNLLDKKNVLSLALKVKKMSFDQIFSLPEQTTYSYLVDFGFSKKMIDSFFGPFYSGIFFEPELNTSARKFLFTYKMFSEGHAAIPNNGIQSIPEQLKSKLKTTTFHFNTKVLSIKNGIIKANDETYQPFDYVIDASNRSEKIRWLSCDNLYFKAAKSVLREPILGLIANRNTLINNIHFVNDVQKFKANGAVLSVTIVKQHNLSQDELIEQVKKELTKECGINNLEFLQRFRVVNALPELKVQRYEPDVKTIWADDKTVVAGDSTCNASFNSAMLSGKMAAHAVLAKK